MLASRVESESKPEPKRWESDDYKADLSAKPDEINPEIKDLCPIVITTIAAAPTHDRRGRPQRARVMRRLPRPALLQ